MNEGKLRFAIIGCGAVAETHHLPILHSLPEAEISLLVDINQARVQAMASRFGVANITDDYKQVANYADAAIVAVPHSLHAPVALSLLNSGVHVLIEKPMAMTTAECDSIIQTAEDTNTTLAVGLMRRFYPSAIFVKQLLTENALGAVHGFDMREGGVYDWPVASDFFFRKEAGGGVLFDTGAHVLDLVLWWLGDWKDAAYFDNAHGGVESDCEIHLELASGAKGTVELSRTRNLSNKFFIHGEKGIIIYTIKEVTYLLGERSGSRKFSWPPHGTFELQIKDFISAIKEKRLPTISGAEGRRSIHLIETCLARRQPLGEPWVEYRNLEGLDL